MNIIHWTKKDTPLIKIILIFIFTVEEQPPVKSYIRKPAGGYTFEQVFSTIGETIDTTKQFAK